MEKRNQINAIHHGLFWQVVLLLAAIYIVGVGYGILHFGIARTHAPDTASSNAADAALKERLASTEKRLEAMTETLQSLLKTAPPQPPSPPATEIKNLSNQQLKENAIAFADELRKFEARFQVEDMALRQRNWAGITAVPKTNTDERNKRWTEMITTESELGQQHKAEYQSIKPDSEKTFYFIRIVFVRLGSLHLRVRTIAR